MMVERKDRLNPGKSGFSRVPEPGGGGGRIGGGGAGKKLTLRDYGIDPASRKAKAKNAMEAFRDNVRKVASQPRPPIEKGSAVDKWHRETKRRFKIYTFRKRQGK